MSDSGEKKNMSGKLISICAVIIAVILIGMSVFQLYEIGRLETELNDTNGQLDDLESAWDLILYLQSRYDLIEMKQVDYEVDNLYDSGLINETQANITVDSETFLYGIHVYSTWGTFFRKNPANTSQYLLRDEFKPFFFEVPSSGTYGIEFWFLEPVAGDPATPAGVFPELNNFSYIYINATVDVNFKYPYTITLLRDNILGTDRVLPVFIQIWEQGDLFDPLNAQVGALETQLHALRVSLTFNAISVILVSFLIDFKNSGKNLGLLFKITFLFLTVVLLYYSLFLPI